MASAEDKKTREELEAEEFLRLNANRDAEFTGDLESVYLRELEVRDAYVRGKRAKDRMAQRSWMRENMPLTSIPGDDPEDKEARPTEMSAAPAATSDKPIVGGIKIDDDRIGQTNPEDEDLYKTIFTNMADIPGATARGILFDLPAEVFEAGADVSAALPPSAIDFALAWHYDQDAMEYAKFTEVAYRNAAALINGNPLNEEFEETPTGNLVRDIAAFSVPYFKLATQMRKAYSARKFIRPDQISTKTNIGIEAGAGAVTDMLFKQEEVLANMLRENEWAAGWIPEFMAIEGDDSEIVKRIKGTAEGAALGVSLDTLLVSLRAYRKWRHSRRAAQGKGEVDERTYWQQLNDRYPEYEGVDLESKWTEIMDEGQRKRINDRIQRRFGDAATRDFKDEMNTPLTPEEFKNHELHNQFESYADYQATFREIAQREKDLLFINFARIEGEEDLIRVVKQFIEGDGEAIKASKRVGRGQQKAVDEAVDQGEMSLAELLSRPEGQPLSDVQAVRAGMLMSGANQKLIEFMHAAAEPGATKIDLYNFQKMLHIWAALREGYEGAKADASRSLSIFRISEGAQGAQLGMEIEKIMGSVDGSLRTGRRRVQGDYTRDVALELQKLYAQGHPIGKYVEKTLASSQGNYRRMFREIVAMGLLWNPKTHAKNISSNAVVAGMDAAQRGVAAGWRKAIGGEGVEAGEASAQAFAQVQSMKAAWLAMDRLLKTGDSTFEEMTGRVGADKFKGDTGTLTGFDHRNFGWSKNADGSANGFGMALDLAGHLNSTPGDWLRAQDEFFKMINFEGQRAALVMREAQRRSRKYNWDEDQMTRYVEWAMKPENTPKKIIEEAGAAAERLTFTNHADGAITSALRQLRENTGVAGDIVFLVLPYLNTPANILNYSLDFTPGLGLLQKRFRNELAAGGARADMAVAQQGIGLAMLLMAYDYAQQGGIIAGGPSDRNAMNAIEAAGGMQNSFYVPGDKNDPEDRGKWVSFNDIDQHALVFQLAGQFAEMERELDFHPEHSELREKLFLASALALTGAVLDRSYMQGFSELISTLDARSERKFSSWAAARLGSMVPMSSALRVAEDLVDPTYAYSPRLFGTMEAAEPGTDEGVEVFANPVGQFLMVASEWFPKKKDAWGYDWVDQQPLRNRMLPFRTKKVGGHRIDQWMAENRWGVERPALNQDFPLYEHVMYDEDGIPHLTHSVNLTAWPRVYERIQEMAGHEPVPELGHKSALEFLEEQTMPGGVIHSPMIGREAKINHIVKIRGIAWQSAKRRIMGDPKFAKFHEHVHRVASAMKKKEFDIAPGEPSILDTRITPEIR